MLYSQIFEILLFCLCALLFWNTSTDNKNYWSILILLLIHVISRDSTMADYKSYALGFSKNEFEWGPEPMYIIIRQVAHFISPSVYVCFFLYAIISVTLRYNYIFKNSKDFYGSLLVYVSYSLILQDMVAIRSAVAATLLLYLVKAKIDGNNKKQFLFLLLSITFHYSALFFIIIFFINGKKDNKWFYLILLIVCYVSAAMGYTLANHLGEFLYNFQFTMINTHFNNYESITYNIFNLLNLGHLFVCLFAWFNIRRIEEYSNQGLYFLKLYTIGLCLLASFSDMISVGIRLSELFITVDCMLVPIVFRSVFKDKYIQKAVIFAYSAIILIFMVTDLQFWNPESYN